VLQHLGLPLTGFVAAGTVAGVALGFGAQRIVQDLLAGFFLIAERQYGFGDLIRIFVPGIADPVIGTVEDVSLRITRVRSVDGEVIITANGQIAQVTNLSRDWVRAVIDIPVPVTVAVNNQISDILRQVGAEAFDDNEIHPLLLDPPTVIEVVCRSRWTSSRSGSWLAPSPVNSSRSAAHYAPVSPEAFSAQASTYRPPRTPQSHRAPHRTAT
jgi:small-conductance mechanosensitive channel